MFTRITILSAMFLIHTAYGSELPNISKKNASGSESFSKEAFGYIEKEYGKQPVKELIDQTRQDMSPEIARCQSLECIESLLEKNIEKASDELLEHYEIPTEARVCIKEECKTQAQAVRNQYRAPLPWLRRIHTKHDEKQLGKDQVEKTKKVLKKHDIDPSWVHIKEDNRTMSAFATQDGLYQQATIGISMFAKEDPNFDYTINHEITHLERSHAAARTCLYEQAIKSKQNDKSDDRMSIPWLKHTRAIELEATVRPFMTQEDGASLLSQNMERNFHNCTSRVIDRQLNYHRKSHPACFEWFPYALRIAELRDKGAQPLSIKKTL
jgi:hypothetical protein